MALEKQGSLGEADADLMLIQEVEGWQVSVAGAGAGAALVVSVRASCWAKVGPGPDRVRVTVAGMLDAPATESAGEGRKAGRNHLSGSSGILLVDLGRPRTCGAHERGRRGRNRDLARGAAIGGCWGRRRGGGPPAVPRAPTVSLGQRRLFRRVVATVAGRATAALWRYADERAARHAVKGDAEAGNALQVAKAAYRAGLVAHVAGNVLCKEGDNDIVFRQVWLGAEAGAEVCVGVVGYSDLHVQVEYLRVRAAGDGANSLLEVGMCAVGADAVAA
ncbi:hypothetical protein ACSSS7_008074 [Eimeria intestinalis]